MLGKSQDRCMMEKKILGPHKIEILNLLQYSPSRCDPLQMRLLLLCDFFS